MVNRESPRIEAVPTNLITGFLGVGKTSAVLNLIAQKPSDERWAVLINEFGEIGIDGSLVDGQTTTQEGVFISEVPGGCMCCTAGLPMQVALNVLLRESRPDRLLIEPTGLGHPVEVIETLLSDQYRGVLSVQRTVTLVDARNLEDRRYTTHPTFLQQLEIADVVVANKEDLYSEADRGNLESLLYVYCQPSTTLQVTQFGRFDLKALAGPPLAAIESYEARAKAHAHAHGEQPLLATDLPFPESGYVVAVNSGEGFESIGWRFRPDLVFDKAKLFSFLTGLRVERLKAVFITEDGIYAYNMTRDALREVELDDCLESRVEIIADTVDTGWEEGLLDSLIAQDAVAQG
ncbi:MAG: GTP-binding protein [Halieaceae bacterium]|nr:GTP-binding protein [Halieaceae bacterium]